MREKRNQKVLGKEMKREKKGGRKEGKIQKNEKEKKGK